MSTVSSTGVTMPTDPGLFFTCSGVILHLCTGTQVGIMVVYEVKCDLVLSLKEKSSGSFPPVFPLVEMF